MTDEIKRANRLLTPEEAAPSLYAAAELFNRECGTDKKSKDSLKHTLSLLAQELDTAASLRIGQMDSQSRADDVSREVRRTITSVAERLRAL